MTNKETATMLKLIRELFSVSYSPESIEALSKAIKLIEQIPDEHGDLIDRDEIYSAINSRVALIDSGYIDSDSVELTPIDRFERDVLCTTLHDVVCAKAVIAAERKDDE